MQTTVSQPSSKTSTSKKISPQQRHLNDAQRKQLKTVLHELFVLDPLDHFNFPQLYVDPCSLILTVAAKLQKAGIRVISSGIVGGAASNVLANKGRSLQYADLDLLIQVDFPIHDHNNKFNIIRTCVLEILRDAFYKQSFASPELNPLGLETLSRMYVLKMMKIPQIYQTETKDYWSLICFRNREGRNIELKFEHTMHRAYEFSSHSFVIYLNDSLLKKYARCDASKGEIGHVDLFKLDGSESQCSDEKSSDFGDTPTTTNSDKELEQVLFEDDEKYYVEDSGSSTGSSSPPSRRNSLSTGYQTNDDANAFLLPTGVEPLLKNYNHENQSNEAIESRSHDPVIVETYYVNFDEAVKHLNKRLICVYMPEEIRGGGFLKYCHLVLRGWQHLGQDSELRAHERNVMAIRFSIDFPTDAAVWRAVKCYVDCHFWREREHVAAFLDRVREIYSRTSVQNKQPLLSLVDALLLQNRYDQYVAFQSRFSKRHRAETRS